MAVGHSKKMSAFFYYTNGQRWQLIENQLALAKPLKGWLTDNNRADRQENWWNMMLQTNY